MLIVILGIVLLYFGAEGLVRGSSSLALRMGISPLVAGLTVVAFGTSAPELSVSISSALEGHSDIALGNVIGSNIFNIAVILGISALIHPLRVDISLIRRDIPVLVAVSMVAFVLIMVGSLTRIIGIGLLLALAVYLIVAIRSAHKASVSSVAAADSVPVATLTKHWWADCVVLLFGFGLLLAGTQLFVDGATALARAFDVSDAVIGLTIVAAGTSLPELATSVVAAVRKQSDIAIGNVVGSNIFNVLCILGATAVVSPIDGSDIGLRDGLVMLVLSVMLLPFAMTGRTLSRIEGGILVTVYCIYLFVLWPRDGENAATADALPVRPGDAGACLVFG